MRYIRRPEWALPETKVTPESAFLNRRAILAGMGLGGLSLALPARAATDPYAAAPRNPDFADAGRPVTPEEINGNYNNFYEFGSSKDIAAAARKRLKTDGWTVTIDGMVEREVTLSMDDLIAQVGLEERIYRHRCVEGWSMVAPWIGAPVSKAIALAAPLSSARFVRFESFFDPEMAPGQRQSWYPWPYVEGITIEEAANPLPLLVFGAYGKILANEYGAPVRLHLPWKYGFKSIKSITRITLTDEQPLGLWEELQASEYGFWANVNPEVAHPRWSQATERDIGTGERIPTVIYNGYGPTVASLYEGNPVAMAAGDRLWR